MKIEEKKGKNLTSPQEFNQFKVKSQMQSINDKLNRHIPMSVVAMTIILVYILYFTVQYFSVKPTKFVIVESGYLDESSQFNAMVIRKESNVYADQDGFMDVYIPSGTTAKIGEVVCSVTKDLQRREQILTSLLNEKARLSSSVDYDKQSQEKVQSFFREYVIHLSGQDFNYSNVVKLDIDNMLQNNAFQYSVHDSENFKNAMNNVDMYKQQMEAIGKNYSVESSYTVVYTSDGLEDVTAENFDALDLNKQPHLINRLENRTIAKGDFLFKKIDNLYCYFAGEIDGIAYNYIKNQTNGFVSLFFPTKNTTITVKTVKLEAKNDKYLVMFLADRYINRFLEDRFLPIQINYSNHSGLKIPNSSITKKEVFTVHNACLDVDERKDYFIRKRVIDENGKETLDSVRVKVYGTKDKNHSYILPVEDVESIQKNDVILQLKNEEPREYEDFTINESTWLNGVYVLNKGYSDFKQVKILHQSDNFSIIAKNTEYGIKIYDKIASEADNLEEFYIIR